MKQEELFALERPHSKLLKLYLIRSLIAGPFCFIVAIPFVIRYLTLRYKFDEEGIHMGWGFLFRREINLTYSRIQDIHLRSGIIQRWLGLADLMVQTASGSATPEMTIEGFLEFKEIQDYLYARMRGYRMGVSKQRVALDLSAESAQSTDSAPGEDDDDEFAQLLGDICRELRLTREAIERLTAQRSPQTSSTDEEVG